ncbi:GPO family capsid scaffolding protein [Erwinia psidii]|uniref:Phage capsid protein n=1 Tax=Erwinia psidii TaxID=69224 RepID=A0A3N6TV53_9GAMM|nr:GPO family capsid scaffolding protein [Erwinia psidii]RQM39132.1 phage capsid protein [Erwinia psidii]
MPQATITTDWLCIATSGTAVDGRPVLPEWLHQAAEDYSRDTYTAMIWPHHPQFELGEREFTCNLGEVDELKAVDEKDVTKLYARLIPNQFLIDANQMRQKLFTSAEFWENFAGTGRTYLFGLAVTDIPASLGTQKIEFIFDNQQYEGARGSVETFSLGTLKKNQSSLWGRLFSARKKQFAASPETQRPPEGEDTKQMDELRELIEKMLVRLDALEKTASGDGKADTPAEAAADVSSLAEEIAEVADEVAEIAAEVAEKPEDEVIAAEFTAAKTRMAALMKKFAAGGNDARSRSRRHRRTHLSAHGNGRSAPAAGEDFSAIRAEMNVILEKFNTLSAAKTPLPGNGPADSQKPFSFL